MAAAPANGAGEEGQLRRAAAGATELETRKKKYGVGRENETDLVVGSDKFFVRRGGRRKMEKLAAFSLSVSFLSLSSFRRWRMSVVYLVAWGCLFFFER